MVYNTINKYKILDTKHHHGEGRQLKYLFENNYGASVIKTPWSDGGPDGLWELAVLHNDKLCYDTPITSDVIGRLEFSQVIEILKEIRDL